MIAPPPRCFMCGTARREARIAGKSVSSNAACHSASVVAEQVGAGRAADVVHEDVEAAERLDASVDDQLDARRGGHVRLHGRDHAGRFAAASTSSAASASCSSPRAQMQTRQPSATSARALASPSPRLEPVTTATLSQSPRSSSGRLSMIASRRSHLPSGRGRSGASRSGWNATLNSFFLTNSFSSGSRCGVMNAMTARSTASAARTARSPLVVGGDEVGFAPAQDRRHRDRARRRGRS